MDKKYKYWTIAIKNDNTDMYKGSTDQIYDYNEVLKKFNYLATQYKKITLFEYSVTQKILKEINKT